ncbi:MAG: substrate-binding domain-containing protein [Deltaproteobacteria bacterium]
MSGKYLCLFTLICLLFSGPALAGEQLTICGTGDSQDLLRALASAYTASHAGISIQVPESIGSSGGIHDTALGKCDLGRVARPLKEKEKVYHLNYRLFAFTPVVFVTNRSVRLRNISTPQVVALFQGKITNWRQLGGENAPVFIAIRYHGDSNRTALEENIPALKTLSNWTGTYTYSVPETVDAVAQHNFTISFIPLAMALKNRFNIFRFNGVEPSADNVRAGSYKLVTPLGLVWKGRLEGARSDFLSFINSYEGQRIIAEDGAIPVR